MTRLRARIAERMVQAQATQALLTSFNEVDLQAVNELRARYKDPFEKQYGVKLGFMSFFAKACVEALKKFPSVNASVDGNDIVYHEYFDIGVAVSTDRGLIVPVLRDADQLSFADIEKSIAQFCGARARRFHHHRGAHRRHLHHHQRRRVRLAAVDAHRQFAAERHTGHAQDPGSAGRGRRPGRGAADDVHRPDLRSSHHRRPRGGAVSGDGEAVSGGSGAHGAAYMSDVYDVVVIGAGPAGYPAAIRAGQNKLKVACVDEWKNTDGSYAFGGTCLNAGCIPSKALLESSELFQRAKDEFAIHGIKIGALTLDLGAMQKRRASVVKTMTNGINALFKANGVVGIQGHGRLLAGQQGAGEGADGTEKTLEAKHVILASGSTPIRLRSVPHDGKYIVDSWNALEFDAVPKRLGVIGAGVIGLELGSVWRRLGSEVMVLEALETVPADGGPDDRQGSAAALQEDRVSTSSWAPRCRAPRCPARRWMSSTPMRRASTRCKSTSSSSRSDAGHSPKDCWRRAPALQLDERGFIKVDEHCRTSAANVWAIGDVVRGPMLAHKGKEEGVMVADLIAGHYGEVNYKVIPSVIYTPPEIAWVGQTEEQVKASGRPYKTGTFPVCRQRPRARHGSGAGMAKIVSAKDDDEVLGIHVIGPMAGELIAEAVLAMEYSASTEDIQRTIHAHPTLSEAIHEAALAVDKKAIDAMNR